MKTTVFAWGIVPLALVAIGPQRAKAAEEAVAYTRIDKPYECLDFSWVPRTLAKAPELKSDKPLYNIWVLGGGAEMKKSVMVMILDESEGPGKGYDVFYVDKNLNGDLTDPDERMPFSKGKQTAFDPFQVKDADGTRTYAFKIVTGGDEKTFGEWPSGIGVTGLVDGKPALLYGVGPLPGNVKYTWGDALKTAPVYHLGGPFWYCAMPVPGPHLQPGSSFGKYKAGGTLYLTSVSNVVGDKPAVLLRGGNSGLPTVLRILDKDGGLLEEVPLAGRCACGGGYVHELQVPLRVPPGTHEVVARNEKSRLEYVYTVEIENPDYGKPLPDPGYAALKARFPQAKFASLRRAANAPTELIKAYPEEKVIPFGIGHLMMLCNNLEGDNRGHPVQDIYNDLGLGQHAKDADLKSCLMKFDLAAIPKETKILGAQLRLVLLPLGGSAKRLSAFPLLREWHVKPRADGYTCWYGPLISARDGSKGIQWGKPGCNDPETDYIAALEATTVDVAGFPDKAKQETFRVVSLDVSDIVKKWRSGEIADNGIVLKIQDTTPAPAGPGGALLFASGNHAEAVLRPTLVIAYEGEDPQPQYAAPKPGQKCAVP